MADITSYIIDDLEAFAGLRKYVENGNFEYLSLDVETNSRNEKKAKMYGIGLSFTDNEGFYIPFYRKDGSPWWDGPTQRLIWGWIYERCAAHKMIGWNLVYDTLVFEFNTGYRISDYIYSDGILQKHTLDEERPFGLKECAVKYLGAWADKAQETLYANIKANGGKTTKDEMEMYKADTDVLAEYCSWDVVLTRKLFDIFEARLKEEGLHDLFYNQEIMPLYREVTVDMKRHGFTVDIPYFQELKRKITAEIENLEDQIMGQIQENVSEFETGILEKDYPVRKTGSYPKMLADMLGVPVPEKDGKVTLSKKEIERLHVLKPSQFTAWMLGQGEIDQETLRKAQYHWFFKDYPDRRYVFNLKSNDHLGWLMFTKLGETPLSKTETGKPQCDDDFLETLKTDYIFVAQLIDLKKLLKLSSTYIDGILERQIDGVVYTSMLQFGTTSGRYSSRDPNLQNIPRVKDDEANLTMLVLQYTNAIKRGFIAPPGFKIVNADYSSLEPVCFAHMSGDEKLREVFRKGYDLYSAIAIDVFGITGCSANKKDPNYLKNKHPELRQKAKLFCLAVVYGAEAGRISQAMDMDYQSADEIIDAYLDAYPELKKYMDRCDFLATKYGIAKTEFGRIRHLPQAKEIYARWGAKLLHNRKWVKSQGLEDIRYKLKNALNNSKNFPIQGLAAHIVNRAMIATIREFKRNKIEGWIAVQVHDEITCVVREDQAEFAAKILRECMENTTKISVPLQAEPIIADNWSDAK